MVPAFLRLVRISLLLSLLFPVWLTVSGGLVIPDGRVTAGFCLKAALSVAGVLVLFQVLARILSLVQPSIDSLALRQAEFLDRIPARFVGLAIMSSAAVSLFLELAMIRWQGTVWAVFAYYKNFGLLSCFAGLGLGYALSSRDRHPMVLVLPLLAFQVLWSMTIRYGLDEWGRRLLVFPLIREQFHMGLPTARGLGQQVGVYFFLTVTMLLTALAFVPVGQVCGRLLERTQQLRAYGLNLLGSILGVALMLFASFLWTPPTVWFASCFLVLIGFQLYERKALLLGLAASLAAVVTLSWPVSFGWELIYSPYQLLERGRGYFGLMMVRAAGHYYQRVFDLSKPAQAVSPDRKLLADYYELPYRLGPSIRRVAVVGAGAGNDVAAGLRRGAGHIDAIEIDPAILALGVGFHPERPYDDSRVTRVVNDARAFLRSTTNTYDLIVYGLLDSHTLLSHASSVRLDSFVYTVEGLREARARLTEGGVVSLSFSVMSDEIGRKIYLMMEEAFDGRPPVCIFATYDRSVIFAQSKNGGLSFDPALLEGTGFEDLTAFYANPKLRADIATDDWPFFYMPQRIYPTSYLYMVGVILVLSLALFGSFFGEKPRLNHAAYFFMGAGFMLVETKGITEMGLILGNTWQVIGIVIAAILVMAFLANLLVQTLAIQRPVVPCLLLIASLGAGLLVARAGGFSSAPAGQIAAVIVLTCPMFFSGLVFSTLLAGTAGISGALAMNLLGAMVGGLLEYNAMYFGFQFLYWIAMGLYAAALASFYIVGDLSATR